MVLPSTPTNALRISQILFVVMGSSRYRHRTMLAYHSWCSIEGVRCIFIAEYDSTDNTRAMEDLDASIVDRDPFPAVRVRAPSPPKHCCIRRGNSKNFFCEGHRAATLRAQYRFLPALQMVRCSPAFVAGRFRWIVLVDDDSFVFPRKLRWLLSRLDHSKPLYLGDFGSSGEATRMRIPHFACGGGGSVLSAAALKRMEVRGSSFRGTEEPLQPECRLFDLPTARLVLPFRPPWSSR